MSLFPPLPNKKYSIIYADPPWAYGKAISAEKHIDLESVGHYKTVGLQDLMGLDIRSICDINCLLYLWTTGPCLQEGISLLEAWGFSYKQVAFVWYKQNKILGNYSLTSCEFVLVGKIGSIPNPNLGVKGVEQFISKPIGRHSAKPLEICNRIDKIFPAQSKIELFARPLKDQLIPAPITNWDYWGNEV